MQLICSFIVVTLIVTAWHRYTAATSNTCTRNRALNDYPFATKSPYRGIRNMNMTQLFSPVFPNCEMQRLWMIFRHGTRYPSEKIIRLMQEELPRLQASILLNHDLGLDKMCEQDIAALRRWHPSIDVNNTKLLALEGEEEMIELGERYKVRFGPLLQEEFDPQNIGFRVTATQRTFESAVHFGVGLYGRWKNLKQYFPKPMKKDPILRFYKNCPRWREEVDKNPEAVWERKMFERSDTMTQTVTDISKRLGFSKDVYFDLVELMYLTCAFETAMNRYMDSPWCTAFSNADFEVFEYREDLEYYWIDGYGYPINFQQACVAVKDFMDFFRMADEDGNPRVKLYFTHSGTILKLLARLGLFKDSAPLMHSNFYKMKERQWKTSFIDAFSSHIAVTLHKCQGRPKVAVYVQERLMKLPNCKSELCDLSEVEEDLGDLAKYCDFDAICSLSEET